MSSGLGPDRTVRVGFVADLTQLERGVGTAETKLKSGSAEMVSDLGKVETGARRTGTALHGVAAAVNAEAVARGRRGQPSRRDRGGRWP